MCGGVSLERATYVALCDLCMDAQESPRDRTPLDEEPEFTDFEALLQTDMVGEAHLESATRGDDVLEALHVYVLAHGCAADGPGQDKEMLSGKM